PPPESWRGVSMGGSFYRDAIPIAPEHATGEHIAAAFAVYRTPSTEIMGEWLQLKFHEEDGTSTTSRGGYLQASHEFGKLRPYYRYDRLEIPTNTPFIGSFCSSPFHIIGLPIGPPPRGGLQTHCDRRAANTGAFNE